MERSGARRSLVLGRRRYGAEATAADPQTDGGGAVRSEHLHRNLQCRGRSEGVTDEPLFFVGVAVLARSASNIFFFPDVGFVTARGTVTVSLRRLGTRSTYSCPDTLWVPYATPRNPRWVRTIRVGSSDRHPTLGNRARTRPSPPCGTRDDDAAAVVRRRYAVPFRTAGVRFRRFLPRVQDGKRVPRDALFFFLLLDFLLVSIHGGGYGSRHKRNSCRRLSRSGSTNAMVRQTHGHHFRRDSDVNSRVARKKLLLKWDGRASGFLYSTRPRRTRHLPFRRLKWTVY